MQSRKPRRQRAIGFFRPGRLKVPTAEARLNVANGYLPIKSRERGAQHCSRVALHKNQIRCLGSQVTIQSLQGPGGQAGQGLAWPHQIQVNVRLNAKDLQHLIQHLPMLRRHTDPALKARVLSDRQDDRGQFDSLRPGAEDNADFHR